MENENQQNQEQEQEQQEQAEEQQNQEGISTSGVIPAEVSDKENNSTNKPAWWNWFPGRRKDREKDYEVEENGDVEEQKNDELVLFGGVRTNIKKITKIKIKSAPNIFFGFFNVILDNYCSENDTGKLMYNNIEILIFLKNLKKNISLELKTTQSKENKNFLLFRIDHIIDLINLLSLINNEQITKPALDKKKIMDIIKNYNKIFKSEIVTDYPDHNTIIHNLLFDFELLSKSVDPITIDFIYKSYKNFKNWELKTSYEINNDDKEIYSIIKNIKDKNDTDAFNEIFPCIKHIFLIKKNTLMGGNLKMRNSDKDTIEYMIIDFLKKKGGEVKVNIINNENLFNALVEEKKTKNATNITIAFNGKKQQEQQEQKKQQEQQEPEFEIVTIDNTNDEIKNKLKDEMKKNPITHILYQYKTIWVLPAQKVNILDFVQNDKKLYLKFYDVNNKAKAEKYKKMIENDLKGRGKNIDNMLKVHYTHTGDPIEKDEDMVLPNITLTHPIFLKKFEIECPYNEGIKTNETVLLYLSKEPYGFQGKKNINIARLVIDDDNILNTVNVRIKNIKKNIKYVIDNNILLPNKVALLNNYISKITDEDMKKDLNEKMKSIYKYTCLYANQSSYQLKNMIFKEEGNLENFYSDAKKIKHKKDVDEYKIKNTFIFVIHSDLSQGLRMDEKYGTLFYNFKDQGIKLLNVNSENIEQKLFDKFDKYWNGTENEDIFKIVYDGVGDVYVLTIGKLEEIINSSQ